MKTKIIKTSLLIALILVIIIGVFNLIKNEVIAVEGQANPRATGGGTLAEGEPDPDTYSYHINTGQWEAFNSLTFTDENGVVHNTGIGTLPGFQIYCINPGAPVRLQYELRYAEALSKVGDQYTRNCGQHASTPYEGSRTPPVYVPVGTYKLPVAAAYIVSDEPIGEWSIDKQRGIWNLRDSSIHNGENDNYEPADDDIIIGDADSHSSGPSSFDQEAKDYGEYDSLVRDKGLQPTDKTSIDDVYTKVNQNTQEYTVGPFNMEYTNGIYGTTDDNTIAFSGISEMIVIGYNSKKQEVRDDIEIEKFILKDLTTGIYGEAREPEYFEPSADLKVDETEQVYPESGQDFQIVFKDPNEGLDDDDEDRVAYISIKIKLKYMLANGEFTKLRGTKYTVRYSHDHSYNPHTHTCHHYDEDEEGNSYHSGCHDYDCNGCETTCYLEQAQQQWLMAADAVRSIYEEEFEIGKDGSIIILDVTMDLGGHVWEDGVGTKESKADGISSTSGDVDKPLQNVKVTLYTEDGEIAKLLSDPDESGISEEKVMHRVNPTYTDEDGNYLFEGLNSMKKYYVTFEYNGQIYLPTEYLSTNGRQYGSVESMVNAGLYNTEEWEITSKGTEDPGDRDDYDHTFEEIRSYPENYRTSNSLGQSGRYNAAFTQKDLMGYTLDRNGDYRQTEEQLIDGYLYDSAGLETDEYSQGIISEKVREYVESNREFPDENAMEDIYSDIAGNDDELWQKLQFIEDCKILSYTQPQDGSLDLYPVYDEFKINHAIGNEEYETAAEAQNGNYDLTVEILDGIEYNPIYPGQFFVNQGLWRRQEFDSALRKDVYRAVLKINNKTVMYKYDKRTDDEKFWDINVRMSDYDAYYNTGYNRELYLADYEYDSVALNHPGANLEIYVTYKITIRNQSMSIMNQIKEVVDFYDKEYTYRNDLSWVTYTGDGKNNSVPDQEYYDAMVAESTSKIKNARDPKTATSSRYGSGTHSNVTSTYNAVYVKGLEDKKLATGESAYIYLTFQVNKQNGKIILDDENDPKQNLSEINGYVTYYKDGTELPNGISKGSRDIAGLLDRDSNPGNLTNRDIRDNDRYEKNFEDDTDRAKSLRIHIEDEAVRKANGTVWEDERTKTSGDSIIGDGERKSSEEKVEGVTVQLVEKTTNGKEYIWQETRTNSDGKYNFEGYIPGNYIIRFYYGHNSDTVELKGKGGSNSASYNGQDFKSTTYQSGINQNGLYKGYTDIGKQNETGTYGYDIYAADADSRNLSDAKDLWSTSNMLERIFRPSTSFETRNIQSRSVVNAYSTNNITNGIAEILASPHDIPTYNGTAYTANEMRALIDELIKNTYMTAETGEIVVEFEYDRQQTDGLKGTSNGGNLYLHGNDYNGKYTLNNIDLGLSERPKAQLEIDKSIANIKITLANGTVLFDVNQTADDVIWKDHEEYNIASKKKNGKYEEYYGKNGKHRYSYREEINKIVNRNDNGLIQITMDEELMHGATIQITYKVKITNVGEVDYEGQEFYYRGNAAGNISTTKANTVVDYIANNLQFAGNGNTGWNIIQKESLTNQNLVNNRLSEQIKKFNNIITTENEALATALKPGEKTEKQLILTQLITTENSSDDLTYSNMVEIAKTSNTVGRRMAYSVVGNQNPTADKPSEVDSSMAEKVIILPPFGEVRIYYILGAVIGLVLIGGIALIIRKVLKK